MIPKIIHYCWFGRGEKPELAKKCIASWKKFCPDFEIREWNEDNCDYLAMPFMAEAYAAKKYAFVSDVMRLAVLEQYGGVYFDTDVEVLRDISPLLGDEGFIGFENDQYVASGLTIAAEAHHPVIQAMIEEYKKLHFAGADGSVTPVGCPHLNTDGALRPCAQRKRADGCGDSRLSGGLLQPAGQRNGQADKNGEHLLDPLVFYELAAETHTDEGEVGAVMAENAEKTTIGPILMLR